MKPLSAIILLLFMMATAQAQQAASNKKFTLVIHGGAGTILKKNMTPEKEQAYQLALNNALQAGYAILNKGGTALDAVEAAVRLMEDSPLFNAGKGAVFTNEGKNELDASIMDGKNLGAGAVASVTTIRNPITAARAVMEKSQHVMMVGSGAEKFAQQQGLVLVDPSYFYTEERWQGLLKVRAQDPDSVALDHGNKTTSMLKQPGNRDDKYGTVGAVALDQHGNLAAATSTGGMTNKKFGRIGDAPIIGAGTYANNATCAVSCTGWGEFFIRLSVAKTVSDLMEYKGLSVQAATNDLIHKKVPALGGDGGLIAVDKSGNVAMPFNTEGMYRGYIKQDGKAVVQIYKD
ncbi:isoaspartyl peptidase/L-asparaginase family protein [Paracnuella aquatica]|uniref:isoaspartyl peptidase/L-asparaginase family protein n=1 Tax=Paracnuella aquatica TaxID=2268757 RepID=UPI000DEF8C75|nr:isoaspartyl peptidase/L-asparaginase [Paracnuella aquatica]RPD51922.1 isoaspartyl peptidase/L-asparaginase [Paracnuella aquatica]